MSQPHVLYVIDSLQPSGAEWSLVSMAPHLVASGFDLEVVHFSSQPGLGPRFEALGVPVTSLTRPGGTWRRVRDLRRLIAERRPDLVHTTLFQADVAGRVAARAAGVPVVSSLVNTAYGATHREATSVPLWKLGAAHVVDTATAQLVTRFHAISGVVADEMAPRLRVRRSRIDVAHRGRDPQILGRRDPDRRERVRTALGLAPDVPVVVAAARHEPQKALDVAVAAFAEVRSELPDAVLLIAGRYGAATGVLRQTIGRTGTGDSVELLGWRDDVPDLLAAGDAFVFPSRWEGLGSVLIEAMALEIPIVTSDLPVVRELLVDDDGTELAWFTPVGDPTAFAGGLMSALADAGDRPRRARERFLERFTAERATSGVLDIYQRVLGR